MIPIPNTSTITTSEASSANIGGSIIPQSSTLGLCKLYETSDRKSTSGVPTTTKGTNLRYFASTSAGMGFPVTALWIAAAISLWPSTLGCTPSGMQFFPVNGSCRSIT